MARGNVGDVFASQLALSAGAAICIRLTVGNCFLSFDPGRQPYLHNNMFVLDLEGKIYGFTYLY